MNLIFLLSLILITISGCVNNNPKRASTIRNFDDVFQLEKEFILEKSVGMIGLDDAVVDSVGNIICVDIAGSQVLRFNDEGTFIDRIGNKGEGPGEFKTPFCIGMDKESLIYIGDQSLRRVNIFDKKGNFLDSFIITEAHWSPLTIKVGTNGFIYMMGFKPDFEKPGTGDWIHRYTIEGKYINSFCPNSPIVANSAFFSAYSQCNFDLDGQNNLFVVKETEYKIFKYSSNGNLLVSFGEVPLYFKPLSKDLVAKTKKVKPDIQERLKYISSWTHPSQIVVTRDNLIIILITLYGQIQNVKEKYAITIYRTNGELVADGIKTDYRLLCKDNNNKIYMLISSDEESETSFPKYKIGKFALKTK